MKKIVLALAILSSCFQKTEACTAFQLKSADGAFIYCRTLEFGFSLDSNLLIVPQKTAYVGTAPNNKPGIQWKSKYGFIGLNQAAAPTLVSDGMNEKGLVVGCLYLPGYAQYESPNDKRQDQTLGAWELPSFLLSNCATVEDVKAILPKLLVAQEPSPLKKDFVLPLHFYICDNSGKVIIVEFVNGQRQVYDNPLGILTNSPPFPWHVTNLSNFTNLSPVNVPSLNLTDFNLQNYGQGSGLLGLPGDYTPPSRFIRAALFSGWAHTQETAIDTIRLGFHVINTFDIFEGIIRSPSPKAGENLETTEWVVVHDRTNLKTYFRSYGSLQIQMVDMKKIDFSQPGLKIVPMNNQFEISEDTDKAVRL